MRGGEPVSETCLDCFAFAAILIVNNDLGAGFPCALRGFIGRAVVDHQDAVELLARSSYDVADVIFVLIGRNNCSGLPANLSERVTFWLRHRRTTAESVL